MRLRSVGTDAGSRLTGIIAVSAAAILVACGSQPSDDEATAVAALGGGPTPSIEGASMFRGGPSRDGVYHVDGPPKTASQAWTFEAVGDAYSSPAVAKGVVYFGGSDEDFGTGAHGEVGVKDVHLYAVDAQTGQEKWRFATGGSIFSSPAVVDDVVYFGSADHGFYAVDAVSGSETWRFEAEGSIASSPAVVDDAVYFTDRDGYLYALNTATGQELWRFRVSERAFTAEGSDSWDAGTWSSPAVVDGTVYTGSSDGHVYAVDAATGQERWKIKTRGDVWTSPAVANGTVYFGSYDTHLYAVDAATGAERWRYKTPYRIRSSPAVIGRVVVFGSKDGNLFAVDAERGEERWRYRPDFDWATIWTSSPIIVRSKNLAYVGVNYWSGSSGGGQVLAVDLDSGQEVWQTRLPGGGFDSTLTITEDAMFVTGADGTVYALR